MGLIQWAVENIAEAEARSMLETFSLPGFEAALIQLFYRGLLTALPQMQLDLDNQLVVFPQPDTSVPILKGILNAIEVEVKKKIGG